MQPVFLFVSSVASFWLFLAAPVYPHGGGLDAHGCHNNRKAGGYHCHRGPLAGEVFGSKAEMLERLERISSTVEVAPDKRRHRPARISA